MKGLDKQWHVGHHNWKVKVDDVTDSYPHQTNYDRLVKQELVDLELEMCETGGEICDPEEGESGGDLIEALNGLSGEIKENLEDWKLFYVSTMAYKYAAAYK